MKSTSRMGERRGAIALEAAMVLPVFLFIFLGMVVGGMGVFRYQQVACLAEEAARFACVRGGDFERDADSTSPTSAEIVAQAIVPRLAGMDASKLSTTIEWIDRGNDTAYDWNLAHRDVKSVNALGEYVANDVRVTVVYTWSPGVIFGTLKIRNVAISPMAY